MISTFIVRKLMDSNKASDDFENFSIPVSKSKIKDDSFVDHYKNHNYLKLYEFKNKSRDRILPRILCNLVVHSMVFSVTFEKSVPKYIVFNSEKSANLLYLLSYGDFCIFIDNLISDDIVETQFSRINREKNFKFIGSGKFTLKRRSDFIPMKQYSSN
jgi:hypothetical protein